MSRTSPVTVPCDSARDGGLAALQATVAALMARDAQRAGALAALLQALLEEVRALRAELTRPRRRPRVVLLAVIATAVQGRAFTAGEVFAHARVDAALATALGVAGITNPRALGHYLRKVEGRALEHVRVTRLAEESAGIVWRCEFCR